jgi:hypothetical protein
MHTAIAIAAKTSLDPSEPQFDNSAEGRASTPAGR